jgi:TonB family protein
VGEDKAFLEQGGTINLVLEKGTVRFELDPDALERSGIRFGAEVLSQALIQHGVIPSTAVSRKIEYRIPPRYPELAHQMKLTGTVQVEATVKRDGTVKKVKLIGGHPVLGQAALDAVIKWRYEAAAQETVELVKLSF